MMYLQKTNNKNQHNQDQVPLTDNMQTAGDVRVVHRKTVKGTKESKNQKTYNN